MNQMMKSLAILCICCLGILMTSCDKEDAIVIEDIENYTDGVVANMQDSSKCGRRGCFEFVFPISIDFPDGSTTSVEDYSSLRDAIKAYREANPDSEEKPTLGFPLEVIDSEGHIISVTSQQELRALRRTCHRARRGPRGNRHRGNFCFSLVFPVTLEFPDASTTEVENRMALKMAIRTWKSANPNSDERPSLMFPLTVALEDGTETEVASKEDLEALKAECHDSD